MAQPFETYLECFLWDLVDEGVDGTLDRIKGETGVRGVVVPVHQAGARQFRPHAGVSPRTLVREGGAQFQPDATRYAGTRLRPVVDDWLRKSNPLKAVAQGCRDRGLKLCLTVEGCGGGMGRRYEHAAVRDVWGDRHEQLCPVNPDVQEYVRSLLTDLGENYAVDSVVLSAFGFADLIESGPVDGGSVLGPVETWLKGICFCESCRQLGKRDGVDVDTAARLVTDVLEAACATGEQRQGSAAETVDAHPEIKALLEWRTSQLDRWLPTLKPACGVELILEVPAEPLRSGVDSSSLTGCCDAMLLRMGRTGAEEVEDCVRRAGDTWDPEQVVLRVDAGMSCPDSGALVAAVALAGRSGLRAVHVGDYGSLPLVRLDWVRQAVRFAHREARG